MPGLNGLLVTTFESKTMCRLSVVAILFHIIHTENKSRLHMF